MIGIQTDGLPQGSNGLLTTACRGQGYPKTGVSRGKSFSKRQGLLLGAYCRLETSFHPVDDPQAGQGVCMVRLKGNGPAEQQTSFFEPSGPAADDTEPVAGGRGSIVIVDQLAIDRFCCFKLAELLQC